MLTHDEFLNGIERFLTDSGMSATAFGRAAVGDPNLVRDLRAGRSLSLRTAERISNFIREQASAAAEPTP